MNPTANGSSTRTIELLSPAGDWDCLRAAVENGADAVYFGLDCGFNARHRAKNFGLADLDAVTRFLRRRGVRAYVTVNTLIFPSEMARLVDVVQQIAGSGVDAVLVQDFGAARLIGTLCPEMEIHASTQMSLTSAETIDVAARLGIARVVLARELSVQEIRQITANTSIPVEVFIHGALCVAYSGQCLTSESLGGRSANRGQCAQACRLPYELVCDGEDRDLGDVRYLLSPQDLAGYASIPALIDAGVASLKIEGRLKTPEYVANITAHYRQAIDQYLEAGIVSIDDDSRREMELSFSRGFSPGWLDGNDHKRLVPGRDSAKRGVVLGEVLDVAHHATRLKLRAPLRLGDGVAIHGRDAAERQGGRVYSIEGDDGESLDEAPVDQIVWMRLGRGEVDWNRVGPGDTIFKNDDPKLNRRLRLSYSAESPRWRRPLDLRVVAHAGQPLRVSARTTTGKEVCVTSEIPLERAVKRPIETVVLREKLGRLGGTPFKLGELIADIEGSPMVPLGQLNQLRRELVDELLAVVEMPPTRSLRVRDARELVEPIQCPTPADARPRLAVLCRTMEQLAAACEVAPEVVYVDFQDIRQYAEAISIARTNKIPIAVASVRIQKPGETGLLRVLNRHRPDFVLARNLAAIDFGSRESIGTIADFSLNVANHRSAEWIRSLGACRITVSYDLNRDQISDLVGSLPPDWLEVVIHQHVPMFHMEHCVFCSVLSPGTDKTNCGRPCDTHQVQLRDRVGAEHRLHADVACRNTLYNATPQSGAEVAHQLAQSGVSWYRVELLDEGSVETRSTVSLYRRLLRGDVSAQEVWQRLRASNRLGVTRGTLEAKRNPLAIL